MNSQGMKNCKSTKSFVSSYLLFTQMIGLLKFFDMFTAATLFFSARFWNMCKPRKRFYLLWRAGSPALAFYGKEQARLLSWLGMLNAGWLSPMQSEIFLQMKFIILQGCPTKQAAFLTWQPTSYNQLLIQPFLLVLEGYFA